MVRTTSKALGGAAASAVAALCAPASAQDDKNGVPVIVVTGTPLPDPEAAAAYDVTVLDRAQVATSPSGRIEEVLATVPGFQQFRRSDSRSANPSAQGATLRALGGNATSRALVLLDGVPMADPFFGYIPFNALLPELIDTVTVRRGGGSGPFGGGALAGTIELDSVDSRTLGPATARGLLSQRGESEASLVAASDLAGGFGTLAFRRDAGQGFFTAPPEQRVPASVRARYRNWTASARAVVPVSADTEVQARILAFDDARTLRFAGARSTSRGQDASVRLISRGRWAIDVLAYVQARDFSNIVVSATSFAPVLDQRGTPSTGLGGKLEVRPPVGAGRMLRLGADYRRAEGEVLEDALSAVTGAVRERRRAGGTTGDIGLFVEGEQELGRLLLTGGIRADRFTVTDGFLRRVDGAGQTLGEDRFVDREGWEATWRAAALLDIGAGLSVRGAAYTGVRLPTLNELYRPFVIFPVTTLANSDLRNERLRGYEVGVRYASPDGLRLSLTAFDNRVTDAVANVTLDPVTRQRQNIAAIRARGVEADVGLSRGAFRLDAGVAFTDAETRAPGAAFDGSRPAQTPRLSAGANAAFVPAPGWRLAATVRHVGRQFEDDLQTEALPPATTLGAYAQMPLGRRLFLIVRGENLTDERVVTRNQGGSIDLGTPRTLWAGVQLSY